MNITTSIVDIGHGLDQNGGLGVLNFAVLATADTGETFRFEVSQIGGNYPPPAGEAYTAAELTAIAETVAADRDAHTAARTRLESMLLKPLVYTPPPVHVPTDAERKQAWADQIDSRIAYVYSRYTRFQLEYELREAAALTFKQAGYTGQPDELVARFARNKSIANNVAADLILVQSTQLRGAVRALGNLRMDKYLVTDAVTLTAAQTSFETTMAAVDAIDRSLA